MERIRISIRRRSASLHCELCQTCNETNQTIFEPSDDPFRSPGTSRRRAKIVCTIGPVSNSEEMIRDLMRLGMDVARLNFSHGTHEQHAVVIERLRKVAQELDRSICILQDLQGPKIRTGRLAFNTPVALKKGQTVTITPKDVPGTTEIISTTYQNLADDVKPGERILLSDGRIELVVQEVRDGEVVCEVLNGGMLGENQGINLPGTNVSIPSLTEKDLRDLEFGLKQGVDLVAISFVRTVNDVVRAKNAIAAYRSDVGLIAKLEKPQAIDNLDGILEAAVGVMVARGDLGVEVAPEKVPLIQKYVIRRALDFRRPVITATQMLESMTESPRPTRAEASDVANAVFDGTDAVMLSGETASGKYPREAVEMMARIVAETEAHSLHPLTPGTSRGRPALGGRDHLRVDGARGPGPEDSRHRGVYRNCDYGANVVEVSSCGGHLRILVFRDGAQPHECALGNDAADVSAEVVGRAHGAVCGRGTKAAECFVARRCFWPGRGHAKHDRRDQFYAFDPGQGRRRAAESACRGLTSTLVRILYEAERHSTCRRSGVGGDSGSTAWQRGSTC